MLNFKIRKMKTIKMCIPTASVIVLFAGLLLFAIWSTGCSSAVYSGNCGAYSHKTTNHGKKSCPYTSRNHDTGTALYSRR